MCKAINSKLKNEDIKILDCFLVPNIYHSRYCTKQRTYMYRIIQNNSNSPFLKDFAWFVNENYEIDIEKMKNASNFLLGTKDFIAFMKTNKFVKKLIK
jgi:tRNA pseudouridine38-40 synthase